MCFYRDVTVYKEKHECPQHKIRTKLRQNFRTLIILHTTVVPPCKKRPNEYLKLSQALFKKQKKNYPYMEDASFRLCSITSN